MGEDAVVIARLRAAGCVFAEDEAGVLSSAARSRAELDALVERRVAGEPLEQVVGWAEFAGLRILVGPGVFVPRRRSEFLVRVAAGLAGRRGTGPSRARVLVDLCCGSGALGLAVAAELVGAGMAGAELAGAGMAGAGLAGAGMAGAELAGAGMAGAELAGAGMAGAELAGAGLAGAELAGAGLAGAELAGPGLVDAGLASGDRAARTEAVLARIEAGPVDLHAADLDPAAVACARWNLEPARGRVYHGDLFDALPPTLRARVDVLICNAPYVPSAEIAFLPAEARDHEPLVALDGGLDGLAVLRRAAGGAPGWLAPGGILLVETSEQQGPQMAIMMAAVGLIAYVHDDEESGATVVTGQRPALTGLTRESAARSPGSSVADLAPGFDPIA